MNRLAAPGGGALLLSAFPGLDEAGDDRRASVARGLAALRDAGATTLLTFVEEEALSRYRLADYGAMARAARLVWLHLPIADFGVPDVAFLTRWAERRRDIHDRLDRGETVALHCRAGLGRTGTVAAMILVERGLSPGDAIAQVRAARPGTIETAAQEAWVRALRV